jgi:hypothetical protein
MSQKVIEHVQKITAAYFGLTVDDMLRRLRDSNRVHARQMGMYILRKHYNLTTLEIKVPYNTDHTNVLHAVKQIENYVYIKDKRTCNDLGILMAKLKSLVDCETNIYVMLNLKSIDVAKFDNEKHLEKELLNFVKNYIPAY